MTNYTQLPHDELRKRCDRGDTIALAERERRQEEAEAFANRMLSAWVGLPADYRPGQGKNR